MATLEEKFRAWKDDSAEHAFVFCQAHTPFSHGDLVSCEGCQRAISAWPAVIAWRNQFPEHRHLFCREQCMPLLSRTVGPFPYGGEIKSNELPDVLKKHKP